jgi:hypothetical protein
MGNEANSHLPRIQSSPAFWCIVSIAQDTMYAARARFLAKRRAKKTKLLMAHLSTWGGLIRWF